MSLRYEKDGIPGHFPTQKPETFTLIAAHHIQLIHISKVKKNAPAR